jgi:DNA-binding GntR family transcriptional regulator
MAQGPDDRAEAAARVLPLKRPGSLRELIYADLRTRLQACAFGPDDRLVDVDIAARHGTSRMPVREALLQLVNEGYLVGTTRGFMVPVLSERDILDIFEVRKLLEPRAAAQAARDLDPAAEAALDQAMEEARAAQRGGDVQRLILANIAFRGAWLGAVRNPRLAQAIARFVDHVQAVRLATLREPGVPRVVIDRLAELHAAFRGRDPIAAGDRMAGFLAAAEQAYLAARAAATRPPPRASAAAG